MVMFLTTMATMTGLSQTTFFSDTFNNGSTVNSATPAVPTVNSTSYEVISSAAVTNNPTPSIAPGNLVFGCPPTSSGVDEIQALFSSDPINLTTTNDYLTLVVVFTNQSLNTLSRAYLAVGLYNSGGENNYPVPGGMNGTETMASTINSTGNCQLWQGYFGQQTYTGNKNEITARLQQTGANSTSQELLTTGSGTYSFQNPTGSEVGSAVTVGANATMTSGTYTEVFTISMASPTSLAITNWLYAGTVTNSANLVTNMGGVASGSTFLTTGFNALAMGWYQKVATPLNNIVGIQSINVFGHSTAVSAPPIITSEPANEFAVTNSYVQFSTAAVGADVAYQWYLNGVPLANGGTYSGATGTGSSSTLVISPAVATNAATALNGYYCVISGVGGYTTNTITNSLTLVAATNLVWVGTPGGNWDVDTTADWETTNASPVPAVFTGGDAVSFSDATVANATATLVGNVAPASISIVTANGFTFTGTGSIVGPAAAVYDGESEFSDEGEVTLNSVNAYTGGTLLTNGILVNLQNYGGLGNGPVVLGPGGTILEIDNDGSATSGVNNNINVASDSTFYINGTGTFAAVFFGGFYGSSSATLTLEPAVGLTPSGTGLDTNRMRFYGTNTACNANIFIDGPATSQAQYNGDEIAFYNNSGTQTYNGVISGNGGLISRGNGSAILNGQNTFSGGTTPTAGPIGLGANSQGGTGSSVTSGPLGTGVLLLAPEVPATTGTGEIEASGGAVTVGNTIQCPSGTNNTTLEIVGTNNLTLSGPFVLDGADGLGAGTFTNRLIQTINTGQTRFSGNITGSASYGLGIFGTTASNCVVALSGADSYGGMTGITNTTVLIDGTLTTSAVVVTNKGTLGGTGTITGPVTVQSSGNLAAGDQGIGTLHVTGAVTFLAGSTNVVYLSGSGANSTIAATSVALNGTLAPIVTSGTITLGQTFTLYSGTLSGSFTATNGTAGPGLGWSFNPATGVLTAVAVSTTIVPTIPPHVTSFSLSGNNVNITATNGVNGGTYYLLGSTNVALPLNQWVSEATNVVTASGGTETFSFTGTNVVSGTPGLFLILSSTNN
jgi:autotransporter-associated beta strand protein